MASTAAKACATACQYALDGFRACDGGCVELGATKPTYAAAQATESAAGAWMGAMYAGMILGPYHVNSTDAAEGTETRARIL